MHFEENTKLGRATVSCNGWTGFWVKGKSYQKTLEWVGGGSKHSVGFQLVYAITPPLAKRKNCSCARQQWLASRNSAPQILAS